MLNGKLDYMILDIVKTNPCQLNRDEYKYISSIVAKDPGNMLVYGLGKDSNLWIEANKKGRTIFLEHEEQWLDFVKKNINADLEIFKVVYKTQAAQGPELLGNVPALEMPEGFPVDLVFDHIFVDAPQSGGHGRFQSIYTASITKTPKNIWVHDCDREPERVYSDFYFGEKFELIKEVHKIRHYRRKV